MDQNHPSENTLTHTRNIQESRNNPPDPDSGSLRGPVLEVPPIIFNPTETLMRSNMNVYGMIWGKSSGLGPVSNLRTSITIGNRLLNLGLLVASFATYKPDDESRNLTDTG